MLKILLRPILLVSLVIGPWCAARPALTPSGIYESVSGSVARLSVRSTTGKKFVASAFLVYDDKTAITAWHAVHDAESVEATFDSGERFNVTGILDYDRDLDLAIVQLEPTGRRPVKIAEELPVVGSWVYAIGSPRGYGGSIVEGLLSAVREIDGVEQFQVSCPFSPGNSGGPIVDDQGNVLGVASWSKANAQNLNFAVPAKFATELNRHGPVLAWSDLAERSGGDDPEASAVNSEPDSADAETVTTEESLSDSDDFLDFRKAIKGLSGERVVLTIHGEEGDKTYSFRVP